MVLKLLLALKHFKLILTFRYPQLHVVEGFNLIHFASDMLTLVVDW